jgi:ATP-dependent exoDNAse (exonuclease V) beta subunit
MTVVDAAQRAAAIDVRKSFCVTAPAGSGKTELLIQRYLALLSRVDRPEQVLAITFTRKAAAEMRERVLQALADADAGVPVEGEHQGVTRGLARAALRHGIDHGWNLRRDVARLNIRTIDGYCSALTRQMPVLSRFGGQADPVDDATLLYEEAVSDLFDLLGSDRPEADDLQELLLHFDNNWERLAQLLVSMLSKRDQWQDYLGVQHSPDEAETHLRHYVTAVIEDSLQAIHSALTPWSDELLALLQYAQGNLEETVNNALPGPCAESLTDWRRIRSLLLTSTGTFRKRLSVKEGFPAGKGEPQGYKERFAELVSELAENPDLEAALNSLSSLPEMTEHTAAWQLVVHLSHVLPLLSACLLVVFARRGVVDHTQVALSALEALGEDDAPTDLALRLDYAVEHILVDEFQDTAINQYKLVSRLTRGWGEHNDAAPEAPRTVFIVGDGMQSIYGFRNANVGLFLTAQRWGFNGVIPEHLALQCNFRSSRGIVDWVNDTFQVAFPADNDIRRGRVSFSRAAAVKPAACEPAVSLQAFHGDRDRYQEADWVVAQVREGLADPTAPEIAILGRTRAQLAPIVQRLRSAEISFASEELDPLARSPAVVDLLTLCRALANPADRVAWFALLRAPWCGLSLADLQRLADSGPRDCNVAGLLNAAAWPSELSPRGRGSLQRVAECLDWVERHRDRLALRVWVEQAWELLGGPECLAEPRFLADAARFLTLLEEAEAAGIGLDAEWLHRQVDRLYAAGDDPGAKVQVMTLHKAKGLEFDWVIIPSLGRGSRSDDRALLLWDESVSPDGERAFLLAADDHSDSDSPTLYNYLKLQRREKTRLENTRLLYVGATRAISRLFLSACLSADGDAAEGMPVTFKPPPEGALLYPIWSTFRSQMQVKPPAAISIAPNEEAPPLWRATRLPVAPTACGPAVAGPNCPEEPQNRVERIVGTVIHECLECVAAAPELVRSLSPDRRAQLHLRLRELGLWGAALDAAVKRVEQDVERTLADEQGGRWILDPRHREARTEMPLTILNDGKVQDIVIDRSFIDCDSAIRWVIDYKSSLPAPGCDLAVFTAGEAERYRTQLRVYRDALRELGAEPVRCALYFTGLALLHPLPELDD